MQGTSAGLGAVAMPEDLGVDFRDIRKLGRAVMNVRIDASTGRRHCSAPRSWRSELMRPLAEALQLAEKLKGSDILPHQHCGFHTKR